MASRLETTRNGHATQSRGLEGIRKLQNDCAYKPHKQNHIIHHTIERIKEKVERELAEEQAGFRPGRGTGDMLCAIQVID